MKQEDFDRFFKRNDKEKMEADIVNFNEFNDKNHRINLYVFPCDDDCVFLVVPFETVDDFQKGARAEVEEMYKVEEIESMSIQFVYWTETPDDYTCVDVDEMEM